jgi:hypothetical protein
MLYKERGKGRSQEIIKPNRGMDKNCHPEPPYTAYPLTLPAGEAAKGLVVLEAWDPTPGSWYQA